MWILRYKNKNSTDYEIIVNSIVERKTYNDLLQSITNSKGGNRNRYIDQKRRILASGIENRFYIIEGDIRRAISESDRHLPYANDSQAAANRSRLNTALAETQLSGFHIVKTADSNKTASQLLAFSKRFICNVTLGYRDYDEWMTDKTSKKVPYDVMYRIFDPATMMDRKKLRYVSSTLVYMIKGIRVKTGKLLLDHFGTFSNFYNSLINENTVTRMEILRDLGVEMADSEKIRGVLLTIY
jgi:ERCC4-type nuclease